MGQAKSVVVIGAGMVGVATASWLLRDGHHVTLVDPEPPGKGASYGNAGCFNPSSVVPIAMPGTLKKVPGYLMDPLGPLAIRWSYLPTLAPWLFRYIRAGTKERIERQALALKSLLAPCLETLIDLARYAGAERYIARNGVLIVYRSRESWEADSYAFDIRRRHGIEWHDLDADGLRQFDSNLSRAFIHGRHLFNNGHCLEPGGFVAALADAVQRGGGTLVRARATGFSFYGEKLRAVATTQGDIQADAAVVAAGAHSKNLASLVGDEVPLETERGYHLMLRNPEVMPRVPTTDAEAKFVATPMDGGLRFAGTVEFAGVDAPPNWARAERLLQLGRKLYPGLAESHPLDSIKLWMGHRPSMPDSLPVLGPSRRSSDVFHAFGHGHVGMTGGPYTGKVIADLVAGRPSPVDLTPFRPGRF
jgi:D-amino-acid dehydrogenase